MKKILISMLVIIGFGIGCATTQKNYDYNKWCTKRNEIGECIAWSNKKK